MGILKNLSILLVLLFSAGCWPTKDLRNFTLYGYIKNVDSSKLKIDGVYYQVEKKRNDEIESYDHLKCIVFYSNGTFLDLHSYTIKSDVASTINEILENFEINKKRYSNHIDFWGAYKIVDDTILIQSYRTWIMPKPGTITFSAKVFNYKMQVINDTVLGEFNDCGEYYLYKIDKPDSVNLFMTNKRIKRKLDRLYHRRHHFLK